MAKCKKCGRKGLFLHLSPRGLCRECEATQVRADEAEKIEKRAADADKLLKEAIYNARTAAQKQLDEREKRANETLAELIPRINELQERYDKMAAGCEQAEKRRKTAENRIIKAKQVYDSMKYAMDSFMNPSYTRDELSPLFKVDFSDTIPEEPPLKCLTMKTLRTKYKANEKQINEITAQYQAQYTTKANATIYKLMVMALNAELLIILSELSYGEQETAIKRVKSITTAYYAIAAEGSQTIVNTLNRFIGQIEALYINAVNIEYEYFVQRERAKEEQRALREQMRQEAEEKRALEEQRKQIEKEEKKYEQEMLRVQGEMGKPKDDAEMEALRRRLEELEQQLSSVSEKKEEIAALQNGKAGTVYIISNIGSFGDDVFKIGMTRRLEPQERVNELGDASVPFPFDVHSFIFSEDAVALETALHRELNAQRVNKVNLRKEFFRVSLDDLEKLVERIDPTAPFQRTILAEQYKQSLSIGVPTDEQIEIDDE